MLFIYFKINLNKLHYPFKVFKIVTNISYFFNSHVSIILTILYIKLNEKYNIQPFFILNNCNRSVFKKLI